MVCIFNRAFLRLKWNMFSHSTSMICRSYKNINSKIKIMKSLNIRTQSYALELHQYRFKDEDTLSNKIFQHIKTFPDNNWDPLPLKVSNVFDNNKAIQQLQSIVVHSLYPNPGDVVKLFSSYASSSRFSLQQVFVSGDDAKILKIRVESSIPLMSNAELNQMSISLKSLQSLKWKFFKSFITDVWDECLSRAENANSLSEVLSSFIICMEFYGNSIFGRIDSQQFITSFGKHLTNANPLQLIQILYFIGLSNNKQALENISQQTVSFLIPHFEDICFIEAGIAISGLFRIGFKFGSNDNFCILVANKFKKFIDQNNCKSLNKLETFAIVSTMKFLRFSLYTDIELLQNLKLFLLKLDEVDFNPRFVCHTIALYANSNFYDKEVFDLLSGCFFNYLKSSVKLLRIKDVSRALWGLSHVQHKCDDISINLVVKELEKFGRTGEIKKWPNHFVDSTLAFAVMNSYQESLIKTSLDHSLITNFRKRERSRFLSRLLVLHEVQKVVFPNWVFSLPAFSSEEVPQRSISNECFFRPAVKHIRNAIQWLEKECGVQVFQLRFLVPYINYCSVVVTGRKSKECNPPSEIGERVLEKLTGEVLIQVAVEINDAHSTLFGGKEPIGMEALKRRLLLQQGWQIKTISGEEIEKCGDQSAVAALLIKTFTEN